jgi:hypothetical protein
MVALKSGPEDLRLGYLAFGLLAGTMLAGACLNLVLGFWGTLPFVLLGIAASFIFARASLSVEPEPGRADRWLIYPSLIVVYVPVTAMMMIWPVAASILVELILTDRGAGQALAWAREYPLGTITAFTLLALGSLWCAFLGFVAWRWPEVVRDCYAPFANQFCRRPGVFFFSCTCFLAFLACMAFAVEALRGKTPYF